MERRIQAADDSAFDLSRFIVDSTLITILIVLAAWHWIFAAAAFAFGAIVIIRSNEVFRIGMLLYFLPFATIFKLQQGTTSLFTFWEVLVVALELYSTNWKRDKREKSIYLFAIVLLIAEMLNGSMNIVAIVKMICNCYILLIIASKDIINSMKPVFMSYIIGFIISSAMAYLAPSYFSAIAYEEKTVRLGTSYLTRFSGFYGDPNYYVVNLIISLLLLIILFNKKKLRLVTALIYSAIILFFVAMTNSKSGLLMLAFPAALLVYSLWQRKYHAASVLISILAVIGAVLIFNGSIGMFSDVVSRLTGSSSMQDLTTERWGIWGNYLNYFNNNPFVCILGRGLSVVTLDGRAAHNTYIDMIYQTGVVGAVLLCFIMGYAGAVNKEINGWTRRTYANRSIVICILIMYFFLSELQYFDPPFHIALAIIVLNMKFSPDYEEITE